MKLIDFQTHFIERLTSPWLTGNPEQNTADKIIYGSPEREIASCLVTWIPSMVALNKCVERGVDLLLVHEPTFYTFPFNEVKEKRGSVPGYEKLQFIENTILPL